MHSNKPIFYIAICFCLGIIGLLVYVTGQTPIVDTKQHENVRIVESPKQLNMHNGERNFTNTILTSKTETPIPSYNIVKPTETSFAIQDRQVQLLIKDYFDQPIEKGVITINEKEYTFKNGCLTFYSSKIGKTSIHVDSDGYQSCDQEIDINNQTSFVVHLEYLSSFRVECNFASMQNDLNFDEITLLLWKDKSVIRPVPTTLSFITKNMNSLVSHQASITDHGIQISANNPIQYDYQKYPAIPFHNGYSPLDIHDTIVRVSDCGWYSDNTFYYSNTEPSQREPFLLLNRQSQKLRMIDTLCLSHDNQPTSKPLVLEFLRDEKRYYSYLPVGKISNNVQLVGEYKTDPSGKFIFQNLTPALYFVQAVIQHGNGRSSCKSLFPSMNGCILTIQNSAKLRIVLKREGINQNVDNSLHWLNEISIVLRGQSIQGIRSQKTDYSGSLVFQDLPWGNYSLTVYPNEKFPFSPIEQQITVNQPVQQLIIPISTGNSYTGKVLVKDTGDPVPDYPFQIHLYSNPNSAYASKGNLYDVKKTDDAGNFEIHNLDPGYYLFEPIPDLSNEKLFLPIDDTHWNDFLPIDNFLAFVHKFTIEDQNIKDIIIWMQEWKKTRIQGSIQGIKQTEYPSVRLTIHDPDDPDSCYPTCQSPVTVNDSGTFELQFFTRDIEKKLSVELQAIAAKITPPHWKEIIDDLTNKPIYQLVPNETIRDIVARGSTKLDFMPGDTIDDVILSLQQDESLNTLNVIVKANDESYYSVANLSLHQNGLVLPGNRDSNGLYCFSGFEDGDLHLSINCRGVYVYDSVYGYQTRYKFLSEDIDVNFPSDQDTLTLEIDLREAGYFAGVIKMSNGMPMPNVIVSLQHPKGYERFEKTDENGLFWINNLPMNHSYTLFVKNEDNQVFSQLEQMQPTISNIIIQVQN